MRARSRRKLRACVVGASAGGIQAVRTVLGGLAPGFRPAVIVVQHVAAGGGSLVEACRDDCPLVVADAGERERIQPGHVYLAPPGYHLLVEKSERFALSVDDKVCYARPSIDVLFESAADVWGATVVGIVLTGANDDGARGLKAIRDRGGRAIVQAPDEAASPEMPRAALKIAGADEVLRLAEIAPLLNRLAGATK